MDDKLLLRRGSAGEGAFSLVVTPERAGWAYSGLRVLALPPGGTHTWTTGDDEALVLPLSGSTHMPTEDTVDKLLRHQLDFLVDALAIPARQDL